jgi:hypothetical protein
MRSSASGEGPGGDEEGEEEGEEEGGVVGVVMAPGIEGLLPKNTSCTRHR